MTNITAAYDRDTRRMHRYLIQANDQGIVGTLYISKDAAEIPERIEIELREGND